MDYQILGSSDDKGSEDDQGSGDNEDQGTQAVQPGIRLRGSLDLSADESEDDGDQEIDDSVGVEIKEEKDDEREAIAPPDPTIFTITPFAADQQHGFFIKFNNDRVVKNLDLLPACQLWQLVQDTIHHDPEIPSRTPMLPWITNVKLLNEKSLAFETNNKEDLDTVTTNVQWARDLRDTASAGLKTYKVRLGKFRIRKTKTEDYRDAASIIDKLRAENINNIISLQEVGAIRDVTILKDQTTEKKRQDMVDFLLVFGSREAANAALDMGMLFRNKKRACVAYSTTTEWHQECSNCQGHSHTARDCHSPPVCGRCGYKHATHFCTFAKNVLCELSWRAYGIEQRLSEVARGRGQCTSLLPFPVRRASNQRINPGDIYVNLVYPSITYIGIPDLTKDTQY